MLFQVGHKLAQVEPSQFLDMLEELHYVHTKHFITYGSTRKDMRSDKFCVSAFAPHSELILASH